ncbi:P-loop containing nucleoside triphosphate hydrolase protein [Gorgonomyces haynaldii]|nr:P-loop containing nucleoside triphosphate hydrolase protein [Gorgonomyces haynaldii]
MITAKAFVLGLLLDCFTNDTLADAYQYAILIPLFYVISTVVGHSAYYYAYCLKVRVGTLLIALLYDRVLDGDLQSVGQLTNLISQDVVNVQELFVKGPFLVISSIVFVIAGGLLYMSLQLTSLIPVAICLLWIPVQFLFGHFFAVFKERIAVFRDRRLRYISEMLRGMQLIKSFAWETPFLRLVMQEREKEMGQLYKANLLAAANDVTFYSIAIVLQTASFAGYLAIGGSLTPSMVYSSIIYIQCMQNAIAHEIPQAIKSMFESRVSFKRLSAIVFQSPRPTIASGPKLRLKEAQFSSPASDTLLSQVSFEIEPGSKVAVMGTVGSGKTALLLSLLGEMQLTDGIYEHPFTSFSFCSQSPWIFPGTVKDNIIGSQEYDSVRFKQVIKICNLESELQEFPNRELTFLKENGGNLSGGQRERVALARALYKDSDCYVLDAPFSAIDPNQAKIILSQMLPFLEQKTVILATHHHFVAECFGFIISVEDKTCHLRREVPKSAEFYESSKKETSEVYKSEERLEEEYMEEGNVDWRLYLKIISKGGSLVFSTVILLLFIVSEGLLSYIGFLMSWWSESSPEEQHNSYYFTMILSLVSGLLILNMLKAMGFYMVCYQFSQVIFREMMDCLTKSPLSFFRTHPTGRILNRLAADIKMVDESLPSLLFEVVCYVFLIVASLVMTIYIMPITLAIIPVLLAYAYWLKIYYTRTNNQLKRIESLARSKVFGFVPVTVQGLSSIRAYGMEHMFHHTFCLSLDKFNDAQLSLITLPRWLAMRLDLSGAFLIAFATISAIQFHGWLKMDAAALGLVISSILSIFEVLQGLIRQSVEMELMMIATERCVEYTNLEREPDLGQLTEWKHIGSMAFKNYTMSYAKDSSPVLSNICFTITPKTKLGIVGKSGSGKSSLIQSLYRFAHVSGGSIEIDGQPIQQMQLSSLRSYLTIVPQEPICFFGTIRFNLDPTSEHSDEDLWRVIKCVGLESFINGLEDTLNAQVTEHGGNLSLGQRQLLSLGRSMLHKNTIVILDEATASIDYDTEKLIQDAILEKDGLLNECTVLTVAHRLQAVIDYDLVIVMDQGQIVEIGGPRQLLSQKSHFAKLFKSHGRWSLLDQ